MNVYVVVEGELGTIRVYKKWIPLVNPNLVYVDTIFDISNDNFSIFGAGGYPYYYDVIEDAIADVNNVGNIDRLIIAIDSEDLSYEDKYQEVSNLITGKACSASIYIVVQHFCLETWALGNRRVGPRNPRTLKLRGYKTFFNVLTNDPELLPAYPPESLNRAQFAYKYLRAMLNDRQRGLTYTKKDPKALLHNTYFNEVNNRFQTTGHIDSFGYFLSAFQ